MRFSVVSSLVLVALFSCVAHAVGSASDLSTCLQQCIRENNDLFHCEASDVACQCKSPRWRPATLACAQNICPPADSLVFIEFDIDYCDRPMNSRSRLLNVELIVIAVLSFTLLGLRLVARYRKMWWDDWLHIASQIFFCGELTCAWLAINQGLGDRSWTPKVLINRVEINKLLYALIAMAFVAATLIKVSILCLYLRLFADNKTFRLVNFGAIALTAVPNLIICLLIVFSCRPIYAFWDKDLQGAKCLDFGTLANVQSGFSLFIELMIIILPIPMLRYSTLPLRKKLGVGGIFAIGFIVIAITAVRIPIQVHVMDLGDLGYNYAGAAQIHAWEMAASLFCATAPALRSLMLTCRERKKSRLSSDREMASMMKTRMGRGNTRMVEEGDEYLAAGWTLVTRDGERVPVCRGSDKVVVVNSDEGQEPYSHV